MKLPMIIITIVADSAERARDIDVSRAERAKLRAEREIEEAHEKNLIDQERRAKMLCNVLLIVSMSEIDYKKK